MNIENEIFKRTNVDFKKLIEYGFIKENNTYIFRKSFLNDDFMAIITVDNQGIVSGKIIDLQVNEEYTNIRLEMPGEFVNKVKEEYKNILNDIKNKCFESHNFIFEQTNMVDKYINKKYNCNPEFLWKKLPLYAVYRNSNNNKWFCIIGNVKRSSVNKKSTSKEEIEVINVKVSETIIENLLSQNGYYEAFHMNKKKWISIILDNTLKDEVVFKLIDNSFDMINGGKKL